LRGEGSGEGRREQARQARGLPGQVRLVGVAGSDRQLGEVETVWVPGEIGEQAAEPQYPLRVLGP